MTLAGRGVLQRRGNYQDLMTVCNNHREGFFEGSITLLSAPRATYPHPMLERTFPLCWDYNRAKQRLGRGESAAIKLAEYYREAIQSPEWKVGVFGWDPKGLVPAHYVCDPTAEFRLRIQIWRSGWLSDIVARVLLDEDIRLKSPVAFAVTELEQLNR